MKRISLCVLTVVVLGLAGCGSRPPSSTSNPVNHQATLAEGETLDVASQLTVVPHYRYVDLSKREVESELALMRSSTDAAGMSMPAVSLHSVISEDASQNTAQTSSGSHETGFLMLLEFETPPPSTVDLSRWKPGHVGDKVIHGTTVFLFTDPSHPESKYMYVWVRHGVLGQFDGATRAPTQRWVTSYLSIPERQPGETSRLSSALVPVAGFEYANSADARQLASAFRRGSSRIPHSVHMVLGRHGPMGTLILAEVPVRSTPSEMMAVLQRAGFTGAVSDGTKAFGGKAVRVYVFGPNAGHAYIYVNGGIAVALLSKYPDEATTLLSRFLSLTP